MRRVAGNPVAQHAVVTPDGAVTDPECAVASGPKGAVTGPECAVVAPEGLVDVRVCPGDSRPW